ncbi:TetR/AcrR family transcriptional regulator [Nesterenkonia rhizosphaerae]|uniref:TetR/AcrR family transcriptional regulator n=1 Tax=Nesterenkonia rhizosphaerae TaxID=1348272 RepID=A0ABP9G263_9MICC
MARPRTHDSSVRLRLIEAASEQLASGGPGAVSLRSAAAAAQTTTAAVYSLFGDRESLIQAVIDEGFRRFAAYLNDVNQTDNGWADLLALGIAYRRNALENPHFYRSMFASGSPQCARPTFERLVTAVARANNLDPTDAETPAVRVWAYVHGLVMLELSGLMPGSDEERENAYIAALRAAGSIITG